MTRVALAWLIQASRRAVLADLAAGARAGGRDGFRAAR
jgi:hypothetical protein